MAGVLVIGASGYIGQAVAQAARRDGYTVFAATRSQSKASALAADELVPVVVDPKVDAGLLRDTVERCEFVIDCTNDYTDPNAIPDACLAAIRACDDAIKRQYIYTSGGLVHGHHEEKHVTEDVVSVSENLAWRVEIERRLVALSDVDVTVIRPAFVYGRSGGSFGDMYFTPPAQGDSLKIAGRPDKRWSWVHVDDLADAYVRAMRHRSVAAGRVYDIGEPFGPTYRELRVAMARLAGFDGEVEIVPAEGFDTFLDITFLVDAKRARDELGWVSHHTGIMAQLPLYYESYKAAKQRKV